VVSAKGVLTVGRLPTFCFSEVRNYITS